MSTPEFVLYSTHQGGMEARLDGVVISIDNRGLRGRWIAHAPNGAELEVTHRIHHHRELERVLRGMLATEGKQQ
jgi:hypothetical protein